MSPQRRDRSQPPQENVPPPVNLVDGIPDRSSRRPLWKYVLLAAAFLAWAAVLVCINLSGNV